MVPQFSMCSLYFLNKIYLLSIRIYKKVAFLLAKKQRHARGRGPYRQGHERARRALTSSLSLPPFSTLDSSFSALVS